MKNYEISMTPEPTIQATKLANELKSLGIKCELEKSDGHKHIDIAITNAFLNIEIDGIQHNRDRDQANSDLYRHYHSYIKGYNTLRIPNSLLKEETDIKNTARIIKKMIQEKPKLYPQKYCDTIRDEKEKYKNEAYKYKIGTISSIIIFIIIAIINILIS